MALLASVTGYIWLLQEVTIHDTEHSKLGRFKAA